MFWLDLDDFDSLFPSLEHLSPFLVVYKSTIENEDDEEMKDENCHDKFVYDWDEIEKVNSEAHSKLENKGPEVIVGEN